MKSCWRSVIWIWLLGCTLLDPQAGRMSVYRASWMKSSAIHRVLVLPFAEDHSAMPSITASFSQELQRTQNFEVVSADTRQINRLCPELVLTPDRITAATLVLLAQNYNVQAIICGQVTCRQLLPNTLGLKITLISTGDGQVLWAVDAISRDNDFYSTRQRSVEDSMLSLSPQDFTTRLCRQIVSSLN